MSQMGLTRLTALTRLELIGQANSEVLQGLQALRDLPLQELVLLKWSQIQLEPLLSPLGALTSLKKLHIEDRDCANRTSDATQPVEKGGRQELGGISEALPAS